MTAATRPAASRLSREAIVGSSPDAAGAELALVTAPLFPPRTGVATAFRPAAFRSDRHTGVAGRTEGRVYRAGVLINDSPERGWGPAGAPPHQGGWLSGPVIDEYSGGSVSGGGPGVGGAGPRVGFFIG